MTKRTQIITVRKCKNFNNFSELRGIKFEINVTGDPNEMWLIWKTWFLDVLNKHAPVSDITIKGTSLSYIAMDVRQMIRQRYYLRKMANKTGSPYLRQAFQQIRNKITYSIRKARADYFSKSIEEYKGDLRKTWKILKQNSLKMKNQTVVNQINLGGKVITEKQEICETFNEHFVYIGEKLAAEIPPSVDSSLHYILKTKKAEAKFQFKDTSESG